MCASAKCGIFNFHFDQWQNERKGCAGVYANILYSLVVGRHKMSIYISSGRRLSAADLWEAGGNMYLKPMLLVSPFVPFRRDFSLLVAYFPHPEFPRE